MKIIDAVETGKLFLVATCNRVSGSFDIAVTPVNENSGLLIQGDSIESIEMNLNKYLKDHSTEKPTLVGFSISYFMEKLPLKEHCYIADIEAISEKLQPHKQREDGFPETILNISTGQTEEVPIHGLISWVARQGKLDQLEKLVLLEDPTEQWMLIAIKATIFAIRTMIAEEEEVVH